MNARPCVLLTLFAAGCGAQAVTPTAPAPTINALQIVADQKLLDVGSDLRLRAVATMTDGATLNFTSDLKWATSDNSILDITTSGVVTAVSAGEATITLTWNGISASTLLRNQQTRSGRFVRGRVRDFQTQIPVSGIQVQFSGFSPVTTTADGVYSIWLNGPGSIEARTSSALHHMIVTSERFDGDLMVDTGNTCVGRYGHVIDESTGLPVSGALVALVGRQATTGADGSYRIEVSCSTNGSVGFNTTFIAITRPGYSQRGIVVGRGVAAVERLDVALVRTQG